MSRLYNDEATKVKRRELRKNSTDAERKVWSILKGGQMGARFFRQYCVGQYILDFYAPQCRLGIEIDGGQHAEDIHKLHDDARTKYLATQDIRVLRFWNNEVMQNLEGVWNKIREAIDSSP